MSHQQLTCQPICGIGSLCLESVMDIVVSLQGCNPEPGCCAKIITLFWSPIRLRAVSLQQENARLAMCKAMPCNPRQAPSPAGVAVAGNMTVYTPIAPALHRISTMPYHPSMIHPVCEWARPPYWNDLAISLSQVGFTGSTEVT